jgi:hypothetical protein
MHENRTHTLSTQKPDRRSSLRRRIGILAVIACLGVATTAHAKGVFLNGVNIEGVTDQKFENVTVVIDAEGNVLITAKGYDVKPAETGPAPTATTKAGPVTKKYLLYAETSAPGLVQYDIDVFVNSVWVKRISDDERQTNFDITPHVRKGKNVIHFTATKNVGQGRRSTSPQNTLRVIVGEGNIGGDTVMIDNTIVDYTRNAGEIRNFSNDFEVVGR